MKHLLFFFFALTALVGFAQNNNSGSLPIKVVPNKNTPDRPRVPALHSGVTAEYDGMILIITFDRPEGDADITVTDYNDDVMFTGSATTCTPISIMIGEISAQTEIFISTSAGNTYIGYLYAQ